MKIDRFPQNLSSEYERTIFTKIHLDFGNSCQYLTQLSNWEQFRVWKPTLNCKLYLMRFGRINCWHCLGISGISTIFWFWRFRNKLLHLHCVWCMIQFGCALLKADWRNSTVATISYLNQNFYQLQKYINVKLRQQRHRCNSYISNSNCWELELTA